MDEGLNEPLLRDLAAVGLAEAWHNLETIRPADELERAGSMMRAGFEPWRALGSSWDPDAVVGLIKALTMAEQRLKGWSCGSVSPVRTLYDALPLPSSEKTQIADWVLLHTENPWIPFTNFGARSLADYHVRAATVAAHAEEVRRNERQRQQDAQARRTAKAGRDLPAAVRRGDAKAVIALLAKGADPLAKGSADLTAVQMAEQLGRADILEMLRDELQKRDRAGGLR